MELDRPDAFAAAVEPHLPVLARAAGRLGPPGHRDEVLQEALLRAWAHRRQYDPAKGPLLSWLLTIVANEARRSFGKRKNALPIFMTASVPEIVVDDRLDLAAALSSLPPRQRLAVDCFYFIGLSVAQTAAVMSCSVGTVKSALSDARKQLRLVLEKP